MHKHICGLSSSLPARNNNDVMIYMIVSTKIVIQLFLCVCVCVLYNNLKHAIGV